MIAIPDIVVAIFMVKPLITPTYLKESEAIKT
jgi:hypothetical protein